MQQWKEREKGFLRILSGRKSMHFFDIAKNAWERAMPEKKSRKGLIAKINANNLCQRKLF
jgi:hypothetical protein